MEERRIAIMDFAKVKIDNEDDFLIFRVMAERNVNVQCLVSNDEFQSRKDQISNTNIHIHLTNRHDGLGSLSGMHGKGSQQGS